MTNTQNDAILSHLESGASLTPLEALHLFGCMRLAARINDLRNRGHDIHTAEEGDGLGKRWARYTLAPKQKMQCDSVGQGMLAL